MTPLGAELLTSTVPTYNNSFVIARYFMAKSFSDSKNYIQLPLLANIFESQVLPNEQKDHMFNVYSTGFNWKKILPLKLNKRMEN